MPDLVLSVILDPEYRDLLRVTITAQAERLTADPLVGA